MSRKNEAPPGKGGAGDGEAAAGQAFASTPILAHPGAVVKAEAGGET